MPTTSHAIGHAVRFWPHLGIGPMIAAGPSAPPPARLRRDAGKAVPQQRQAIVVVRTIDRALRQYNR